jgi:hypothetical protein
MGKQNKSEATTEVAATKFIQFTFSPIGAYGIAAFIGDVVEANKIVENGHAIYVDALKEVEPTTEQALPTAEEQSPEGAEVL